MTGAVHGTHQERRERTRERLINAAIGALSRKGYAGFRARAVVSGSGLTWGAAQHVFGDKQELLRQVVARVMDRFAKRLDACANPVDAPLRFRVSRIIHVIWDAFTSEDHVAMLEILSGTRGDSCLDGGFGGLPADLCTRIERVWLHNLEGHGISAFHSVLGCRIVVLTLGALASPKPLRPAGSTSNAIIEELTDWVTTSLSRP